MDKRHLCLGHPTPNVDPMAIQTGHVGEISDIVDAILYLEGAYDREILHLDGGPSPAANW